MFILVLCYTWLPDDKWYQLLLSFAACFCLFIVELSYVVSQGSCNLDFHTLVVLVFTRTRCHSIEAEDTDGESSHGFFFKKFVHIYKRFMNFQCIVLWNLECFISFNIELRFQGKTFIWHRTMHAGQTPRASVPLRREPWELEPGWVWTSDWCQG